MPLRPAHWALRLGCERAAPYVQGSCLVYNLAVAVAVPDFEYRQHLDYEIVIGLEVHSQLLTQSKMFCSCAAGYQDAAPNTVVCEVCMGMPGVLPVINERAVELVMATGLALGCTIQPHTKFDRKNYPYPDLMKGYQISQYDMPIAAGGCLAVTTDDGERRIGITRVHLEEDVAKLQHRDSPEGGYSLLDVNRAGVPLMEVVSEPDMRSPEEARVYLTKLRTILRYIKASTANMEEGSFRCDANISLRPSGAQELGTKVEVKNMNSFRSVYSALIYETERQSGVLDAGGSVAQETRGWVEDRGVTVSQRSKEYASDYRYFPEPDLPPLSIEPSWIDGVQSRLPELPDARAERYVADYGLPADVAGVLTASRSTSDFFESVLEAGAVEGPALQSLARTAGNWIVGELARLLNATGTSIDDLAFAPVRLVELIRLVDDGTLSMGMARTVFEDMFESGDAPGAVAERRGLVQISDAGAVQAAVDEAIEGNPQPVADYLAGRDAALGFLVGQVMRITRGKANPQVAGDLLRQRLESMR